MTSTSQPRTKYTYFLYKFAIQISITSKSPLTLS